MKILMIVNFVSLPNEGGNSRFTYILDDIDCKKNDVELITSNFFHSEKCHRTCVQCDTPYKVTLLEEPGYKKNVSLKRFYSHYMLSKNLKKYLNSMDKRPDIIYCSVPSLDMAKEAARYANKNKIRFIVDVQDLWPEAFKMIIKIPIISDILFFPMMKQANYIYKSADEIIAVSETYADRVAKVNKKYKNKLSVFLGTELSKFDKIKGKINEKSDNEIVIVYIGTLGHSYNLSDTIMAIKLLNDRGLNNVKLKIMGDGPLKNSFEELATQLNVNSEFTGRLSYDQMVQELCCCDIAINPIMNGAAQSIINKVGDYAAAGLPVINTQECEEYRSLVEKNNIGLNCKNDPNDIANKIEYLLKNRSLMEKMGQNNRKLAEEKFDRKRTYKNIIKIIFLSEV